LLQVVCVVAFFSFLEISDLLDLDMDGTVHKVFLHVVALVDLLKFMLYFLKLILYRTLSSMISL
jgi:hypothetical protein